MLFRSFVTLTLDDWVSAFNQKFAGLTATATPSETIKLTSNKSGKQSSISVIGGTYLNKWFPDTSLSSNGQSAQFQLNRQTGNLRILNEISSGDSITAGIEDAKGFVLSSLTNSGTYNVFTDGSGRPAELVIVIDSSYCTQRFIMLPVGTTITVSDEGGSVMRLMSNAVDTFDGLLPGDYVYLAKKSSGWLSAANNGLYKIMSKGEHTSAGMDSYIEVLNDSIIAETVSVTDSQDIKAFSTDGYPQVWRGSYVSTPSAAPINDIVASLNSSVMGIKASIYRSSSIKISSNTENGGSIAVPVAAGNASVLFSETSTQQDGNPSHVANRVSDKSLVSFFKRTAATGTSTWLDRHVASDIKGSLTDNAAPDSAPFGSTYGETIESTGTLTAANVDYKDIISFTKGNNKGQLRSVKALISGDKVGTQQGVARTEFDHIIGDEFQIVRPLEFSSDDSVVVVMDKDATTKAVDVKMARAGRVNSGSGLTSFTPTTTEFSANDYDNESNVDFSSPTVWDTTINGTDFSDYAVWMRARNWYASGGVGSSGLGKMLVRAAQYGPNGEKLRFSIKYPTNTDQENATTFINAPSYSEFSYFFGSGPAIATAISNGNTLAVSGPYPDANVNFPNGTTSVGNYYDYTFSGGSLASVNVDDVLSILDTSGISSFNAGQFRVTNKSGNTVRVFNPNASNTSPGSAEVITLTAVADFPGTPTTYTVTTVADVANSLNGKYFIIRDTAGTVAVWFDNNNAGTPEPTHGANRSIKIATVVTGDSASSVAAKIYAYLNQDGAFSVTAIGSQLSIVNVQNGNLGVGSAGTSGFTVNRSAGTNGQPLDGKYFTIHDDSGSVAVWFDVDDNGTAEPFHGAKRSIRVSGITVGSSDNAVASAVAAAINGDSSFSASASGNQITITALFNGNSTDADAGTSGFGVSVSQGSFSTDEVIVNAGGVMFFQLANTTVADICSKINEKDIVKAVPVGSSGDSITLATHEEDYVYSGDSAALAYGHNPSSPSSRGSISLYDGVNWVKSFQNANPNFTMKKGFVLNGVAPSVYTMNTCPNHDTSDLGELLKLIPVTVKNVHHHLTQKALSQLPIVSSVDISDDRKNVQIRSKLLGSEGAIEVIGGSGNRVRQYLINESEVATDSSGNYLLVKVSAYPDSFNLGDTVKLENDAGVKRLSRLGFNEIGRAHV